MRVSDCPRSYFAAERALNGRDSKKIANNTWAIRRSPESIAIRLHSTDVVTFFLDGAITLNTGGWNTITTRSRMNACLGGWAVWSGGKRASNVLVRCDYNDREQFYFEQRITITADALALADPGDSPHPGTDRRNARRRRARPTFVHDPLAGADDAKVTVSTVEPYGTDDEERWGEFNRKFNALIQGRN